MNLDRQRRNVSGRGALLRSLRDDVFPTSSTNSDESRSNISSSTSNDSLLDTSRESLLDTSKGTSSPNELGDSTLKTESGYNGPNTATPKGRGRLLQSIINATDSMSHNNFQLQAAPKPFVSGRGRLLKMLAETCRNDNEDETVVNQSIDGVDEKFSGMSVVPSVEKEPVIKMGTKGRPIEVMTNYMKLHSDPTKGVFEYEVRFNPDVHSNALRHKLLHQQKDVIGNVQTFDGVVLYLPVKLPDNITKVTSVSPNDNASYEIRIIFKRKKRMSECSQLYNVLFDRIMKQLNYVRFGRKKFDPTAPKVIPQHKLEVWPGYVTAVDEYEGGLMLNLDVSHRLLCQNTVLELLRNIFRSDKENLRPNALTALLGSVVLTRYNNRTYRIDDIAWDETPRSTFQMNERKVSYIEYYENQYGIHIVDEKQPLLISREERRVAGQAEKESITFCLIPEICYLTGITDELRSDQKVMRDIATITRVTPEQRMHSYRKFCENVNNSPEAKEMLQNWGLTIDNGPQKIMGRQLDDEKITFGRGQQCIAERGDFNKFVTNNCMLKVIDLNIWLVIHTKRDERVTKSFIELMQRNAKPMGMDAAYPRVECLTEDKTELYVKWLRKSINTSLQIIVIICPSNRDDRYAAIKKVCCSELPIPTQVINGRTLSNEAKNRAIVQKIALQMNCKMGGALWAINIPLKNVMICGIDTYHDNVKKQNSVSALVASLNATFTQWFSKAIIQAQKEELSNGLCQSLVAALVAYRKANDILPDKIIVFRDGVGDGQLEAIDKYEIPQMKSAFSLLDSNYNPGFTFIVVQKRINTRLFAINGGRLENPAPGCVVDHTITRRFLFDFFLVPQNVRQGTVTPTHYIVVHDTSDYTPDILQRLSYKLCFLYYNWPGTVRVPACCQYAHKLAYLVGQSIKRQPAESLSDRLYYL